MAASCRDVNDDNNELDSVYEVIQKLIDIEKTLILPNEVSISNLGEEALEDQSESADHNSLDSSPQELAVSLGDLFEVDDNSNNNLEYFSTGLEIITCENIHEADDETEINTEKYDLSSLPLSLNVIEKGDNNNINQEVASMIDHV